MRSKAAAMWDQYNSRHSVSDVQREPECPAIGEWCDSFRDVLTERWWYDNLYYSIDAWRSDKKAVGADDDLWAGMADLDIFPTAVGVSRLCT